MDTIAKIREHLQAIDRLLAELMPENHETLFERFWAAYPRKVGKPAALRIWRRLHVNTDLLAGIISSLDWWQAQPTWRKDHGQFIPYPQTWLNQRRWEDVPKPEPRKTWYCEDCQAEHPELSCPRLLEQAKISLTK